MDYKYIEQLLEKYWECTTSAEEERILQVFFSQPVLPAHLARYKSLFVYEQQQAQLHLDEQFDERVLSALHLEETSQQPADEAPRVKVQRITWTNRLRPLYRAAASVAIVTLLGTAAHHSFTPDGMNEENLGWDYSPSAYKDTYDDPQKAYEFSVRAINTLRLGAQTASADTLGKKKEK